MNIFWYCLRAELIILAWCWYLVVNEKEEETIVSCTRKQRRAFERILDILEEKRDIREMIMDVEDRKRLLNERDELTDEYYVHIRE